LAYLKGWAMGKHLIVVARMVLPIWGIPGYMERVQK
jgi:hypothetical protein